MAFKLSDERVKHDLSKKITTNVMSECPFIQFMGIGDNAIIKTKEVDGLTGTVTMKMRGLIRNGGISGDQKFEENRGSLTYLTQTVGLELKGNSVESDKNLTIIKQVQFEDFKADAEDGLTESETDKLTRMIIARGSDKCTNIVVAGHREGTACSAIATSDILSVADVVEAKRRAEEGVDAAGNPAPKLRPFKTIITKDTHGVEVKRHIYLMFVGGASAFNIKQDPLWNSKQEAAKDIGLASPIFTGQLGVIEDVVLVNIGTVSKEYAGMYTSNDTGIDGEDFSIYRGGSTEAPVKTEINLLVGASAWLMPMDSGFNYYEEKFDMDRRARVGIDRYLGLQKTKFVGKAGTDETNSIYHNKDYGTIAVVASATRA